MTEQVPGQESTQHKFVLEFNPPRMNQRWHFSEESDWIPEENAEEIEAAKADFVQRAVEGEKNWPEAKYRVLRETITKSTSIVLPSAQPEPPNAGVIYDLLLLVEDEFTAPNPTVEEIQWQWSEEDRRKVTEWASAVHLVASDNDVEIPEMPEVLR